MWVAWKFVVMSWVMFGWHVVCVVCTVWRVGGWFCLFCFFGVVVVMWHWDLVAVAVWTVQVRVDLLGGVWVEVRELFAELIRVV